MAFVKKTWKDRIVQYANRRLLTKSGGEVEQVTVTRDEGTISEAGDQFNASNMNDLEQRVKDGFDDLNAEDIPIESGSSTNTKDYIDTGLSGKQDSLTVQTDTITPSVTGPAIKISKYGKMRQLWVNTQAYSNSGDVQIGTVPNDSKPANMIRFYFGDKSHYISIETDGKIISANGESYVVANIIYMVR